jgi:hypothetical protein
MYINDGKGNLSKLPAPLKTFTVPRRLSPPTILTVMGMRIIPRRPHRVLGLWAGTAILPLLNNRNGTLPM